MLLGESVSYCFQSLDKHYHKDRKKMLNSGRTTQKIERYQHLHEPNRFKDIFPRKIAFSLTFG